MAAAALMASRMRPYEPQRQTFSIASMSASVGVYVRRSRSAAAMI